MPHARHAQSSLPTRMSGKGFIEPHRSHLPRRARTAKDRTKEEKPAKHTPTPLVLESPGVQDADADPLGTGATNMTEPPTSGRTIPATPQAPEVLRTTPPLPARPSTPAQPLSTDTTAPANINDADDDNDRPLSHPAMGLTMELMNAAQAAVTAQAQAQTVPAPLPLPSLPSLAPSALLAAPLPSSTTSPRLGPGSPTPPMTAPLGQNLPRRHRRKEVVKSPSPSRERDVSQEKEEERKEDDFRKEDRRDAEDVNTTTTTPAPAPTPALAADPLAADDDDRPLPHPAMGLTMHLMNAAEAAVTAQAQEQAQAQGKTLSVPPALPLPPLPNPQILGGITSSMPLPLQMGTPPLGLGLGSPTPPTTAPLTSAAATPLGTNLPRRHRRREVVKSPSPSRERDRERSRVRDKDGEEERKGDVVDQKAAGGQAKIQPIRVLRFERPAGGVGVGSPPKAGAGAGASSLPTFPPLGTSPKTNNAQGRPLSTSRSRSRPRARPRASTDIGARHASTSRTREVSERDLRRLAREARRKERGERERRMCVQVLGRDFGVGGGGGVFGEGEGEGEVYGGRVEVGFLDDEAEGIEENEKEEYVLLRAIRPRLGGQDDSMKRKDRRTTKKRDSISSASSSTSSLTFDSGTSSDESSSESESDVDLDSASESNNELSAIPSWFPWLTTYFPSSSSSSSSSATSTSALASTDSTIHTQLRPTTLKLVLKPQPQSTSNNANTNAKTNKAYDYIEGTSALSEEQIREGCEFIRGWLDDSSEGVDEEDVSRPRPRTRTRIRILSPRNRPEDAFAIGLCYLAWAEKRVQHQQQQEEEDINVDPPSPEGPSSSYSSMFSASTTTATTTSAPISVPTLSIPVSFPSLASALSPAVTDYRSPTSPTTPGPGAARLRAHAHTPVRPTFMSRTTSMSTARPGGGVVPPVPATPAGLMARMASLGGGRGVGVGQGGGMGGRGLERKVRMAVVDWGVNDLPPPVSEDVDVEVDVTSTKAEHEREVSVSDTASITSIPRDDSISISDELSEELDEQPQLLPPPPDIYTLSHLHHLYMRLLDDQEVYHPPESEDTSASVSAVGWMGRGALYEARLKADASAAAVNVGGGLGLDELCLDEDEDEDDEGGEDDYDDEEESTHTAELKESNSDTAGSSLNAEEMRGRLRARGVLVHGREAAMGGRDVSSVGASFGGGDAVNDVPRQDEDEAKVVDRKPSLRGLGLGHKLSLSTIDRKASFRRAKERDARRKERDLRRKEREERREARAKPVWKGLRDEWRGVLSFEGVQGLVGVWP